jgi:hypothetical protein
LLPSLPWPRPTLARACALALLVLLGPAPAQAFGIATAVASRDESGRLWLTLQLDDPLEPRVERSLQRGMPATLLIHAELWRRREGWFDRMERAADASVRLRYDVWREEWRIERPGATPVLMRSVDSLETALERPIAIGVPGLERMADDDRCYLAVSATVKPLTVEDAQEVEGWLSGEVRDQRRAGFGVITQLPRSLFDAVRNFTGFGDSHDRATTPEFTPATLPVERH